MPDDSDWPLWVEYLAARRRPIPLRELAPESGLHPLKWCVPNEYAEAPRPRLLKQLCKAGSGKSRSLRPLVKRLDAWLDDGDRGAPDPVWALECLGWCHALPHLAGGVEPATWKRAVVQLSQTARDAAGLPLAANPLLQQLLHGELPLALAYVLPEFLTLRDFRRTALATLAEGLLELTDGEGLVSARHWGQLRPLVASWTRCRLLAHAAGWTGWSPAATSQYAWAIQQTLRLTRADGTQVLTGERGGQWCADFFVTLLTQSGDRADIAIAARLLPGKRFTSSAARAVKLPDPPVYSEWAAAAVLRTHWKRKSPQVAVAFHDRQVQLELSSQGEVVFSGDCTPRIQIDGQECGICSDWREVCWTTDADVDYLELEADCQHGWKIQRQVLLARQDDVFLLADAVLGPGQQRIEYATDLPLSAGVRLQRTEETWDGLLVRKRPLAYVLPLGLPEWSAPTVVPCPGSLSWQGEPSEQPVLAVRQAGTCRRLYVPLFFELRPRRAARRRTWRQLTVAELRVIQSPDVAVGYRVQSGRAQWIVYRSLGPPANRTVLGMNTGRDFVLARLQPGGTTVSLLEIE